MKKKHIKQEELFLYVRYVISRVVFNVLNRRSIIYFPSLMSHNFSATEICSLLPVDLLILYIFDDYKQD